MTNSRTRQRRVLTLPLVTPVEAAKRCGVTPESVYLAIEVGRLPVYESDSEYGHVARLVRIEDAKALWSIRKHPLPHRIDDVFAALSLDA